MARKPAKRPPAVILNPDVDDGDDEVPTLATPDLDGWVYLKRSRKPKEEARGDKVGRQRRKK